MVEGPCTDLALARVSRSFREVLRSFRKIFEVFVASETCWDLFGSARMHSDTLGYVRKHWEAFDRFQNFLDCFNIFRASAEYRRSQ